MQNEPILRTPLPEVLIAPINIPGIQHVQLISIEDPPHEDLFQTIETYLTTGKASMDYADSYSSWELCLDEKLTVYISGGDINNPYNIITITEIASISPKNFCEKIIQELETNIQNWINAWYEGNTNTLRKWQMHIAYIKTLLQ